MKGGFTSRLGAALTSSTLEESVNQLASRQAALERQSQILLSLRYRELSAETRAGLTFDDVGFDVFSATNEDGILLYVFSLIGMSSRRAVDIGAAGIRGSNVANLIVNHGFEVLLVDGDEKKLDEATAFFGRHHQCALFPPTSVATRVTRESVSSMVTGNGFEGEIDLLCLDIDGVDYWIWKALEGVDPRVVVVEYQDILGPDRSWTVPYRADFSVGDYPQNREHYNYCSASLRAFTKLGKQKGYRLAGCNRGGWNAFFIKNGVGDDLLPEVSVESCFRYSWNEYGMKTRFELVRDLEWEEV